MADTLVTVTFESDTGLPADRVVNTFAIDQFDATAADAPTLSAMATAFANFYNAVPARNDRGGSALVTSVKDYLSPVLDVNANRSLVRFYNIPAVAGAPMGSPAHQQAFTLAAPASGAATPLPSEVAVVATLEAGGRADAPVESGFTRPKSRYTGRVFIGPLNSNAVQVVGGVARPALNMLDTILGALDVLDSAIDTASLAADLGVYSRADNMVRSVSHVSIDDAFDTQRRRGEKAAGRRRIAVTSA